VTLPGQTSGPVWSSGSWFRHRRGLDVEWLRSLSAKELTRVGLHSDVGTVTAGELVFHVAYHDSLHLRQLLGMLQGSFEPLRGPMRALASPTLRASALPTYTNYT
jgi:hypothetical protein